MRIHKVKPHNVLSSEEASCCDGDGVIATAEAMRYRDNRFAKSQSGHVELEMDLGTENKLVVKPFEAVKTTDAPAKVATTP